MPIHNDPASLGWQPDQVGELDHRRLKAPSVKLRGVHRGRAGDSVYCIDLRLRRPNADQCLTTTELHSLEHFLLEGLQRLLPEAFLGVGVMGCQTGFYINLLNQGQRELLENTVETILRGVVQAVEVPYARIDQCGHWRNHDLAAAQAVAREVLACRQAWGEVA